MTWRRLQRTLWLLAALSVAGIGIWQLVAWQTQAPDRSSDNVSLSGSARPGLTVFPVEDRQPMPAIEGPTLDGDRYELADQRGEIVVLNVWGSWCGPCRAETPQLVRMANEFRSRGVRFVGVDTRDNEAAARAFVRNLDVPYPSVVDDGRVTLLLHKIIPSSVVPSTVVVDRRGRVAARVIGRVDYRTLRGLLEDELRTENPPTSNSQGSS